MEVLGPGFGSHRAVLRLSELMRGGHLDALGYRVTRDGRDVLPTVARRLQRRVARHLARRPGDPPGPDLRRSVAATAGVMLF